MRTMICALSAGFLLLVAAPAYAQEANGVMMVVKGDIKVTGGKDGKTEAAKIGRKVFAGDTILAGADSRAKIVMSDKNILNISPDSKIVIEKYTNNAANNSRSVELKVEYGKVRATVEQKYDGDKNKFNIKTPTAVAGVRGTDFITGFNASTRQSSIVTFSGTVAVGTPGPGGSIKNPVFVQPGQTTNVGAGGSAEPPHAMPKEELNNMNKESSADTAKNGGSSGKDSGQSQSSSEKKDDGKKDDAKKDSASSDKSASQDQGGDSKKDAKQDSSKDQAKQDQPKQDQAKQDQPKQDSGSGSGSGSRSPASTDSSSSSGSGSGPKSAGPPPPAAPPSMVGSQDLGTAVGNNINVNSGPTARMPTSITNPLVQVPVVPTTNPLLNSIIQNTQNGKSKVNITITPH